MKWPRGVRGEIDDELRFHFDERIHDLTSQGKSRDEAERIAREEFGDPSQVREALATIDKRMASRRKRLEWRDMIGQDLRYVFRTLAAARGFSVLVVVTLALGIGANAALFNFIDRIYFRPPTGVAAPDRLVRFYRSIPAVDRDNRRTTFTTGNLPYSNYRDLAAALPSTTRSTVYAPRAAVVGRGESPQKVWVNQIGPDYFSVLGVRAPALGRYPTNDELKPDVPTTVAVISYDQWQSRFGGSTDVIGKTIELDRRTTYEIVGVAPKGFRGVDMNPTAFWLALGSYPASSGRTPWWENRNTQGFRMIARRALDSTGAIDRLQALSTVAFKRSATGDTAGSVTLGSIIVARGPAKKYAEEKVTVRLAGVAAIVLLIACANVANLLLSRAMRRRREIAIRLALGISRARLMALLMTEAVVLATTAAVLALMLAYWSDGALRRLLAPDAYWKAESIDPRVAVFAFGVALVTALLAGPPAALRAGRAGLTSALKAGAREGHGQRSRLRSSLLVVQAALSVVLLVGAGAFIRSLETVSSLPTGFESDRLMFASIRFDDGKAHREEEGQILRDILDRAPTIRGVESAVLTSLEPMSGFSMDDLFARDGKPISQRENLMSFTMVTPGYFRTTGIGLVSGRDFTKDDRAESDRVMIVNRAMARLLWPREGALGQCLRLGADTAPCAIVIGIVADAHRDGLVEKTTALQYYIPVGQGPSGWRASSAILRVDPRIEGVEDHVTGAIRAMLPKGVYPTVQPMREAFSIELRPWRLGATLFSIFGVLALIVAAIGTYSSVSYSVGQRMHEMGVRIALGARASSLLRLVIGDGVRVIGLGVLVGIGLTFVLGRLVASLLYETSPHEPVVVAAVSTILIGIAVIACLVPALRATRVDPMTALRAE